MTTFGQSPEQDQALIDQCPSLSSLRYATLGLSNDDMLLTSETLSTLIRDFYVHLPLKRSALAIDPVQQLLVLKDDIRFGLDELTYLARLRSIVSGLRDRHTSLELPWSGAVAFLPLTVEPAWAGDNQELIVTKTIGRPLSPDLLPGSRITHWNGVPIDVYVRSAGETTDGANPAARIAIALRSLTIRPLAYQSIPNEDWVTLSYLALDGTPGAVTVPWRVWASSPQTQQSARGGDSSQGFASGLDRCTQMVNNSWRDLFSGSEISAAGEAAAAEHPEAPTTPSGLPAVSARSVTSAKGTPYGYLRIFSFDAPDVAAWIEAMASLLSTMPPNGLIVDVRANPGGAIPAAESLLCMLTNRTVLPSRLQFRMSDPVSRIVEDSPYFQQWQRSTAIRFDTGETFTQGFSLLDPALIAAHVGVYSGPAVLINDALSYSATDFLSAGWQDNGIGPIVGVDGLSGAGGANVWTYAQIAALAGPESSLPTMLPAGIGVNLSVRRSTRVLLNDGLPVEGLGVRADVAYHMTEQDVLGANDDLLTFAAQVLDQAS